MPSVIWTKGPGGVRLVQCLGGEGAPSGGSGSLALAVSLYATTLSTAAIGTIGRPISHRDSTICFPFPTTLLSPRVLLFGWSLSLFFLGSNWPAHSVQCPAKPKLFCQAPVKDEIPNEDFLRQKTVLEEFTWCILNNCFILENLVKVMWQNFVELFLKIRFFVLSEYNASAAPSPHAWMTLPVGWEPGRT